MSAAPQQSETHRPRSHRATLEVESSRRTQLIDITRQVEHEVARSGIHEGVCHLYVSHTTAGVIINEHDDPDVARDIETVLDELVPRDDGYRHAEGNSDSHIKASLVGISETILVERGRLLLGRWQGILFCEFDGPRHRELELKIVPD
ncbi:MAG TPA: secondary thiamine-phosphate synthase enzyme YjbQ [Candidatus Acidoferrales bacterium]|nr:secondary thiamine-phosphate synthase enzyme YjbQ [Candidatus Acidoferrales bacterium]